MLWWHSAAQRTAREAEEQFKMGAVGALKLNIRCETILDPLDFNQQLFAFAPVTFNREEKAQIIPAAFLTKGRKCLGNLFQDSGRFLVASSGVTFLAGPSQQERVIQLGNGEFFLNHGEDDQCFDQAFARYLGGRLIDVRPALIRHAGQDLVPGRAAEALKHPVILGHLRIVLDDLVTQVLVVEHVVEHRDSFPVAGILQASFNELLDKSQCATGSAAPVGDRGEAVQPEGMHRINVGKVFCLVGDGFAFAEVPFQEVSKGSPEMRLNFSLEGIGELMNAFGIFTE